MCTYVLDQTSKVQLESQRDMEHYYYYKQINDVVISIQGRESTFSNKSRMKYVKISRLPKN